jgi:hypothetical protein
MNPRRTVGGTPTRADAGAGPLLERGWADGKGDRRPASRCTTNRRSPPASACLCRPQVLPNALGMMPWVTPWASRILELTMVTSSPRSSSTSSASRRTARPRPSASWRSDTARPSRSRSVRRPGCNGRRRRCPGHCFQCPGGDGRGADRRGGGLRAGSRRAGSTGTGVSGRQEAGPPSAPVGGRAGRVAPDGRARAEAAARCRGGRAGRDAGPLEVSGGRARTGRRGVARGPDDPTRRALRNPKDEFARVADGASCPFARTSEKDELTPRGRRAITSGRPRTDPFSEERRLDSFSKE